MPLDLNKFIKTDKIDLEKFVKPKEEVKEKGFLERHPIVNRFLFGDKEINGVPIVTPGYGEEPLIPRLKDFDNSSLLGKAGNIGQDLIRGAISTPEGLIGSASTVRPNIPSVRQGRPKPPDRIPFESAEARIAKEFPLINEQNTRVSATTGKSVLPDQTLPIVTSPAPVMPEVKVPEIPTVYHGTQREIKSFDPSLANKEGSFAGFTHFSESDTYADLYARGYHAAGPGSKPVQIKASGGSVTNAELKGAKPNVIAAKIGAKNVLDLTKPISRKELDNVLNSIPEDNPFWKASTREEYLEIWEKYNKTGEGARFSEFILSPELDIHGAHVNLPFDAIKYNAHGTANWAVKPGVGMKTPWGTDLGSGVKPTSIKQPKVNVNGVNPIPNVTPGSAQPQVSMQTPTPTVTVPSSVGQLPKTNALDWWNVPKAVQASEDVSFPGRQGLWMIGRKQWWTSWKPMMKSLMKESNNVAAQQAVASNPRFVEAVQNGLALTDFNPSILPPGLHVKLLAKLTGPEEQIGSRVANLGSKIAKYTGIRASNRAYSTAANHLRMGVFQDIMDKSQKLGSGLTPKQVADYINTGTGRGSLGLRIGKEAEQMTRAASALNATFWSPRFTASRIQLLNPASYTSMPNALRMEVLRDAITATTATGSILGLAHLGGADVTLDPTSPDFGKVKLGDTRVDVLGGFGPIIRFLSQAVDHAANEKHKGPDAMRFLESKLSPSSTFIKEAFTGKDYLGKKTNIPESAVKLFIPMIARDIYELQQSDPSLLPLAGAASIGMGLQTYGNSNKKKGASKLPKGAKVPKLP